MSDTKEREKDPAALLGYFETEKAKHVEAAGAIVTLAEKEVRGLTEEEREEVKHHTVEAHSYNAKIKVARENRQLADSLHALAQDMLTEGEDVKPGKARTIGAAFVQSEKYKALQARGTSGKFSTGPITMPAFGAVAGIVTEGTGTNDDMLLPSRIPGIQEPAEPQLGLTDLFGTGVISRGNSVLLVREKVASTVNAAAVVAETAPKPPSTIEFAVETAVLSKIATVIKVSTEFLEDEDAMESYLNGRLSTFVRQEREDVLAVQLLAQAGQTADETDIGGDNLFDAILAGSVKVRREGALDADGVAMTMLDWATLLVTKDQDGRYYGGGPFADTTQRLWGRFRIAITERLLDGNIVVGAFNQGGTVWRKRGGVTVEATNANEDDFLNNLTAIRAEERAVLFLQRPDAFCVVSTAS